MKPRDAWLATLGQLQIQLHRATYNSWIAGSEFVDYEEGVFTISVRNSYAKDWLEQRLYRLVQGSLSTIFGQEVQVKFTVQPQEQKPYAFKPLPDGLPGFEDWGKPSEPANETPGSLFAPPVENVPPVYFDAGDHLNPDYTFDTFVVGASNQLAHAAALGIALDDSPHYNPLLIHSSVGLGKTHLLQAIGHTCMSAGKTFRYIAAETFTNDLVRAIRTRQTDAFREHYREVDVLLVDDVQFICG